MTIFTTPPTAREVGKERDLNGLAYSGVSAQGFEQFEIHALARIFCAALAPRAKIDYLGVERLARTGSSPTRSDPEGSSRNESRLGRCPASHLSLENKCHLNPCGGA
jgi:hypothetical protein